MPCQFRKISKGSIRCGRLGGEFTMAMCRFARVHFGCCKTINLRCCRWFDGFGKTKYAYVRTPMWSAYYDADLIHFLVAEWLRASISYLATTRRQWMGLGLCMSSGIYKTKTQVGNADRTIPNERLIRMGVFTEKNARLASCRKADNTAKNRQTFGELRGSCRKAKLM